MVQKANENEKEEWRKVNWKGSHDVPESGGPGGGASLGRMLGKGILLQEQKKTKFSRTGAKWVVTD